MLTAKDLMNREVITVQADQNVRELAELFLRKNFSGAPVVDGAGKLIGIVTRNDLYPQAGATAQKHRHPGCLFLSGQSGQDAA